MLFEENEDGVHVMNPLNGEYTLCGIAFDGDLDGVGKTRKTYSTVVTCVDCIQVIELCKKVNRARRGKDGE